MVSSHHNRPDTVHHIPRYLVYLFSFYAAFAVPTAYANAGGIAGAAAAAAALGAGEGLGARVALSVPAARVAVGVFALSFCATSYIMGTDLCSPSNPETGGGIAAAILPPAAGVQYCANGGCYGDPDTACSTYHADDGPVSYNVNLNTCTITGTNRIAGPVQVVQPTNDPDARNPPDVAGDNIANNARATAAAAAAAATKARGASDAAAEAAARAAAAATGTGNPSRDRAAGNTAAAAAAAAAAAEAAGGSQEDVKKAARDAAATAAAAADKAAPQDKTCQSNGASVDNRFCTDATAQPKPNTLPVYCTWAAVVCTLIDWVKAEPATRTAEQVIAEDNVIPERDSFDNYDLPSNPSRSVSVNFGGQCPSDVTIPMFLGIEWKFSYHAACEIAGYAKYAFIGVASITAIFIVTGNREPD